MDKRESFCDSTREEQINTAERELSAFILAVAELFGPEQARLSTEDWLHESELMDRPPLATSRDWRSMTVAASGRLVTAPGYAQTAKKETTLAIKSRRHRF